MTFLVDDLLVRPFVGLLEILHGLAIQEHFDEEAIRDEIKENRLLYEIGDRSADEYAHRKNELESQLETAREAKRRLRGRAKVMQ